MTLLADVLQSMIHVLDQEMKNVHRTKALYLHQEDDGPPIFAVLRWDHYRALLDLIPESAYATNLVMNHSHWTPEDTYQEREDEHREDPDQPADPGSPG